MSQGRAAPQGQTTPKDNGAVPSRTSLPRHTHPLCYPFDDIIVVVVLAKRIWIGDEHEAPVARPRILREGLHGYLRETRIWQIRFARRGRRG